MEKEIDIDIDQLTEILDEAGILMAPENLFALILWNDDVHDMIEIVLALYEICGLDNEKSMSVMLEAHHKGKAVVKTGEFLEMRKLKNGLNSRGITATIEV